MGTYVNSNRAIILARLITNNPAVVLRNGKEKVVYPDESVSGECRYIEAVSTGEAARTTGAAEEALTLAVEGKLGNDDIYFAIIAFTLFKGFLWKNKLVKDELAKFEEIERVYKMGFKSYSELSKNEELYADAVGHFKCDSELKKYVDRYRPELALSSVNLSLIKASGSEPVYTAHRIADKLMRYWDKKIKTGSNPAAYISSCINSTVVDMWRKKKKHIEETPREPEDARGKAGTSDEIDVFAQTDNKCCISGYFDFYIESGKTDKLVALSAMYLGYMPRDFISRATENAFEGCEEIVEDALRELGRYEPAWELADFSQSVIKSFLSFIAVTEDAALREEAVETLAAKVSDTMYKVRKELNKRFGNTPKEDGEISHRRGR